MSLDNGLWMKREDELSFTLSGPKLRKLVSLWRETTHSPGVIAWGSSRSAFLLGLAQLCQETRQRLTLILLRSTPYQSFGADVLYENAFAAHDMHWLTRTEWATVEIYAQAIADASPGAILLPEGGVGPLLLPGALSLALDIIDQSASLGHIWDEIWVDAGSGFTAAALILGLGTLMAEPPSVHVVLCAGNEDGFSRRLGAVKRDASDELDLEWREAPYLCHRPVTAASYGATNAEVWQTIARYHQYHGILLDPIYSAKLMMTLERVRESEARIERKVLVIHSGGGLNNFGFAHGLRVWKP